MVVRTVFVTGGISTKNSDTRRRISSAYYALGTISEALVGFGITSLYSCSGGLELDVILP